MKFDNFFLIKYNYFPHGKFNLTFKKIWYSTWGNLLIVDTYFYLRMYAFTYFIFLKMFRITLVYLLTVHHMGMVVPCSMNFDAVEIVYLLNFT